MIPAGDLQYNIDCEIEAEKHAHTQVLTFRLAAHWGEIITLGITYNKIDEAMKKLPKNQIHSTLFLVLKVYLMWVSIKLVTCRFTTNSIKIQ